MNDNFMPDMPEREVDAYPYPNEDVRAYFAARGRQPTPDEQIVLDECLRADSRYNLLSTRYGDVRIADPEVAKMCIRDSCGSCVMLFPGTLMKCSENLDKGFLR